MNPRDFLVRGLLAGLLAGIVAFVVAYAVGEPAVTAAVAIEESVPHHHEMGAAEVSRSLQSTLGLLTGTAVLGTTLGGIVGVLAALALGRFGSLGARGTTLLVAGAGFVAVGLVPFAAYPPNPPAVGHPETIGYRTALYFTALAVGVVATIAALIVSTQLRRRIGGWYAGLAVTAGYLVVVGLALALLPGIDEVPPGFPASVLYEFRIGSLLTQLSLWTVLGVGLAELVHRGVHQPIRERQLDAA